MLIRYGKKVHNAVEMEQQFYLSIYFFYDLTKVSSKINSRNFRLSNTVSHCVKSKCKNIHTYIYIYICVFVIKSNFAWQQITRLLTNRNSFRKNNANE